MHSILSFLHVACNYRKTCKVGAQFTVFPSFEKNFLQIRKQKDSNLITHSLVTVTVTLRVARVSGSGVNTRDIVYVLIIFLMVR